MVRWSRTAARPTDALPATSQNAMWHIAIFQRTMGNQTAPVCSKLSPAMRARLVADKQGDPMEDNEAQHPTFHHRRRGADGQPRIEIVIQKAIFKLTVDGEPNPETLATLMALADELR